MSTDEHDLDKGSADSDSGAGGREGPVFLEARMREEVGPHLGNRTDVAAALHSVANREPITINQIQSQAPHFLASSLEAACRMMDRHNRNEQLDRKKRGLVRNRTAAQSADLAVKLTSAFHRRAIESLTASTMALIAIEAAVLARWSANSSDDSVPKKFDQAISDLNKSGAQLPSELLNACYDFRSMLAHGEARRQLLTLDRPESGLMAIPECRSKPVFVLENRTVLEETTQSANPNKRAFKARFAALDRHSEDPDPCIHDAWRFVDLAISVAVQLDVKFGSRTHVAWEKRGKRFEWLSAAPAPGRAIPSDTLIGLEGFREWSSGLQARDDLVSYTFAWSPDRG